MACKDEVARSRIRTVRKIYYRNNSLLGVMNMLKCPACNSKLKEGKVREEYLGHELGEFDGFSCVKCGETLLTEDSVKKAQQKAKELGLWGLAEKTKIAKSGNSLMVRIKKNVANY